MDDLKPCPFCGVKSPVTAPGLSGDIMSVWCGRCGSRGPEFDYDVYDKDIQNTAITAWNTRTAPKVKPLEWMLNPDMSGGGELALGVFGVVYHASEDGWTIHRQMRWHSSDSPEAAKAAAQADYERRILSALEDPQ